MSWHTTPAESERDGWRGRWRGWEVVVVVEEVVVVKCESQKLMPPGHYFRGC